MKKQLGLLAVLFLLAHLIHLPPTLEDIDSINFALGVRDFDVAEHQPHPPGYPVFVGLAKATTGLLRGAGVPAAAPRGLALLSALSGAALVILLFVLFRALAGDARVAWWAMAIAVCAPLFWFTALRPLSDMTGLAVAVAAQACLVSAMRLGGNRTGDAASKLVVAGALLAGLAAGVRAQTVMLTAPLLLAVLVWPRLGLSLAGRASALAAAAAGACAWAIPLLLANGGPSAYAAALGTQAGEDFSGVVMLWTHPQAGVAVNAVQYSFVWPWAIYELGVAVLAVAALGLLRLAWRAPVVAAVLLVAFAPYAVFHLLFHETVTVRYALPLILPVAFLFAYGAGAAGRTGLTVAAAGVAAASLIATLPAAREYARTGSPAVLLFERLTAASASGSASVPHAPVIGMHAVMKRVVEWHRDRLAVHTLPATHGREWLALVDHWRREPQSNVLFFADPRRTDLALFDPHARTLQGSERWTFRELPFVSGTRPGPADAYHMRPPGWMLDRGWALTAEVGGVTARDSLGPHVQPSIAWVLTRPDEASLIVGGRNLGGPGTPAARLTLEGAHGRIDSWEVAPGFFFRHVHFPAGALAGDGYVPLRLSAVAADDSGRQVRVSLEQFDLQPAGTSMLGYVDGWHEPEYNPSTARSWRWMSERARLLVKPVGRDVTLTLAGESPLRYFDRAPAVRVLVAGVEVARLSPTADFTQDVLLPAKALRLSGGLVVLESELWFTPAERGESADQRHLALRIYSVTVR